MAQEKLHGVSILSTESAEARSIDKGRLINTFARMNSRIYKHILLILADKVPILFFSYLKLLFNRVCTVGEKSGESRFEEG